MSLKLPAANVVMGDHMWRIPTSKGLTFVRPHGSLYRMFNRGSFSYGGRAYAWWQAIPKDYRAELTIDGAPVAEPDYSGLHAAMVYALHGVPLIGDPHENGEFPREQNKAAFNILLNAATPG